MAHDVFISHSSKDKTIADAACACLESRGMRCWVAPRDIVAGADWGSSIIDGISGAKVMVLILSAHSNVSKQVLREIERATSRGIPVIPLRVEDVVLSKSLEYFLSSAHWLDAYKGPLKQNLEKLANNTAVLLEKQDAVRPLDDSLSTRQRFATNPMIVAGVSTALLTIAAGLGIAWYTLEDSPPNDRQSDVSKAAETASFFTGFKIQDVLPVVAKKLGAQSASGYVTAVRPEQQSGVQVGDVVVEFLDKPIGRVRDFTDAWPGVTAAKEYPMTVVRGGKTQKITYKPMPTSWPESDPSTERVFGERRRFDPRNGGRLMSRLAVAGNTLVGIDVDKNACVWTNLDDDAPPVRLEPRTASAVALNATGKTMVFSDARTGELVKWDPSTSAITEVLEGSPDSEIIDLLMTDDGTRAVVVDKNANVRTWDLVARKPSDPFPLGPLAPAHDISLFSLLPGDFSLSSNGRHLGQKTARAFVVWDLDKKAVARVIRSETRITAGVLSPDAASLAIAVENGTIEVWDVAAERKRATLRWHTGEVSSLTFLSPDFLVSSCDQPADGSVIVWDLRDQSLSWGYKATESGGPFAFGPGLTAFRRSTGSIFMAISNIREMSLPPDLESSLTGASWGPDQFDAVLPHSPQSASPSTLTKASSSITATFGDGRTREIVDLDDGSKMVTDRDASGTMIGMEFQPGPRTVGLGIHVGGGDGRELESHVPLKKGAAVLGLVAGGPAEREGALRVGDVITAVKAAESEEPRPVAGLHVAELQRLITGPEGTTVRLQIVRHGGSDPIEVVGTRGRIQAIRRKPAKTDFTNSVGMEFLAVPGGAGFLGIDGGDATMKRHYVRLSTAYLIGVHEVTQAEFAAVMTARPSVFSPSGQRAKLIADAVTKGVIANADTAHHPIETVSWEEAVEFCKRLSDKEGRKYRLPTEAEWEWACRNAGKTDWKNGSLAGNWIDETSVGTHLDFPKTTHPVGTRSPNDAGLYDMLGNVAEWCSDNFTEAGFATARYIDPTGPEESLKRVIRGGSFTDFGAEFFGRSSLAPTEKRPYLGFRVVLELEPGLIEDSTEKRLQSEMAPWVIDEGRIPDPLPSPKLPLRSREEEEKDVAALGSTSPDAASVNALRTRLKESACMNQSQFINFRGPWVEVNSLLGNNRPVEALNFYQAAQSGDGGGDPISLLNQAAAQDLILGWVANDIAWLLATNEDPARRDPQVAIIKAIEACAEGKWQYWGFLDTLAASLAADGRHETATRVAEAALARAPAEEKKQLEHALGRYRRGLGWERIQQ